MSSASEFISAAKDEVGVADGDFYEGGDVLSDESAAVCIKAQAEAAVMTAAGIYDSVEEKV